MSHLIIVGSGVAGLTAALDGVAAGHDVTLLCKADLAHSNTRFAQGGVAVVTDLLQTPGAPTLGDSVQSHVDDTRAAGAGLSDVGTVRTLCATGPAAIDTLIDRGVEFDRERGVLAHGLEAAHSFPRVLHAGGDATGVVIASSLIARLIESDVVVREGTMVVDVVVEAGRAVGVRLLDGEEVRCDAVILATGGAGQLYPHTTNPEIATADGVAIALRAGAVAADLEFYQFHPTSLDAPGNVLISEAVRGEGATLLDADGNRFMTAIHPAAELAPRDVVARGIAEQMAQQPGTPVRLDATALGAQFLAERFPTIAAACRDRGFDWSAQPIPITPAAHYFMGGVRTDAWGRTCVAGLFAVGEVACNGLHGANRLASNSLLEGAVYGSRVIEGLARELPATTQCGPTWAEPTPVEITASGAADEPTRSDLQQLMWRAVGLSRTGQDLLSARKTLARYAVPKVTDAKSAEDANLLTVARAVVESALARTESRGGHFRADFPRTDPEKAIHSGVFCA